MMNSSTRTQSVALLQMAYATAPLVGAAFVWGGYWLPPLERNAVLSAPTIFAIGYLLWHNIRCIASPLVSRRLAAGALVLTLWRGLATIPYWARSILLHHEAASLPRWNREPPIYRFAVIADNVTDYDGLQLARVPLEKAEGFYRIRMESLGWRLSRRWQEYGTVDLIYVRGHRKIAIHLGPCWDGRGTTVEIFRVSYWLAAEEPGTGRRAWHRWIREAFDAV